MNAISPGQIEIDPIEIDPRPCERCGLKIYDHHMIDDGNGPQHFCISQLYERVAAGKVKSPTRPFWLGWNHGIDFALNHAAELEISEIMSTIMVEPEAVPSVIPQRTPEPYRTLQVTVDAFWFVARNHDDVYLAAWLKRHPADAAFLIRLWEAKNARKP
jgi:hypothetical protein